MAGCEYRNAHNRPSPSCLRCLPWLAHCGVVRYARAAQEHDGAAGVFKVKLLLLRSLRALFAFLESPAAIGLLLIVIISFALLGVE